MLTQLFAESSVTSSEFLQWLMPRINYKSLSNRVKYHVELPTRVVLCEYYYPAARTMQRSTVLVDMIPSGSTIHDLMTNDPSIASMLKSLFCSCTTMRVNVYTRKKIIYEVSPPVPSPCVRQIVVEFNPMETISEIEHEESYDDMPPLINSDFQNYSR
jgi:hypothetical protein